MTVSIEPFEKEEERLALNRFRSENPDLFKKSDLRLALHLAAVLVLLSLSTWAAVATPFIVTKLFFGAFNSLLWFSLINVAIHHHHTHHNAAQFTLFKKVLDVLYVVSVPNAPRRLNRYTRAHLNHHARPFHESDVDHHYGKDRYLAMAKTLAGRILYFAELTFVGAHVPGWDDDWYMNQVPLEKWNQKDYREIKKEETKKALRLSLIQWGLFLLLAWLLPAVAWAWAFPMLLVKNWAHFLGQFQHYDERLGDSSRSVWNRTKTYHFSSILNYILGGEISGHFLHHLFPELPYYNVERACKRFLKNSELSMLFVTY